MVAPNNGNGKAIRWLRAHAGHDGAACLTWPYSRNSENGYGSLGHEGKLVYAHRTMCEMVHGPAPSERHYAAHHCGNGHEGCVNPKHIAWKTPRENAMDRLLHGNNSKSGRKRDKLNEESARKILVLKGKKPQWHIAREFGVSQSTVSQIHRGIAWSRVA